MIEFVFDFPGKTGLLLVTAALSVIVIAHHYYTRWRNESKVPTQRR